MDPTETNKQTLRRLVAAADAGDLEAVARCFSPRYVDHNPPPARQRGASDLEGAMTAFREFQRAFPDTRHTIHDLVAEGDRVAARISAEATHTGELFGVAATGERVRNDSLALYRFEDGRIAERWSRERRSTLSQVSEARRRMDGAPDGEAQP